MLVIVCMIIAIIFAGSKANLLFDTHAGFIIRIQMNIRRTQDDEEMRHRNPAKFHSLVIADRLLESAQRSLDNDGKVRPIRIFSLRADPILLRGVFSALVASLSAAYQILLKKR